MSGLLAPTTDLARSPRFARSPGRWRMLAVPLIVLCLLGLGGWQLFRDRGPAASPPDLLSSVLIGPRDAACLRLAIGMDVSGSMAEFATARDAALSQLQQWAAKPDTLRDDDQIAIVDFAFEAKTRLPPVPVAHSALPAANAVPDGQATLLRPLLGRIKEFPAVKQPCDTVLILFSDAQLSDLPATPAEGISLLRGAGVREVRFLVPGTKIQVPGEWSQAFPSARPIRFDGLNAGETALTIGRTIADLTRQELVSALAPAT